MRRGAIGGLALRLGEDAGARPSWELAESSFATSGMLKRAENSLDVSKTYCDCLTACVWGYSQLRAAMEEVPWFRHSLQPCISYM